MQKHTLRYHVALSIVTLGVVAVACTVTIDRTFIQRVEENPTLPFTYAAVVLLALSLIYFLLRIDTLTKTLKEKSQHLQWLNANLETRIAERMRESAETRKNLLQDSTDLRKFQLAVEYSSNQVVIADKTGLIVYANPATEHISGYARSELLNTSVKMLWSGSMGGVFYKNLWKRISTQKQVFESELKSKRKNGSEYWAHMIVNPILDSAGRVEFFVGISRDVTHHREVAAVKAQLDNFFALSADMLCIAHVNGSYTKVSPSFTKILGFHAEELLNAPLTTHTFSEDLPIMADMLTRLASGESVRDLKSRSVTKSGETLWLSWSATPTQDGTFYAIAHDVTQEEAVNRAKTEFVSLTSHQLRTPLAAIGWYAEMLLAGDAGRINAEQKDYVQEIYNNEQNMLELINALLNMSRLELGTFVIEPEATDMSLLAKGVLHELLPSITQKKLRVNEDYAKKLKPYAVDTKLMRVVFQNVLSNAVKYTPENGTVTLRLKPLGEGAHDGMNQDDLLITVSDTGYGIPKNQQNQIFQKMFRAENVVAKSVEGTGFGLYMVKAILEASGCHIWFESTENVGTTFYVVVPKTGMKKKESTKKR